jgi:predicted membrane channel-forming protein YqfA (hemolysin III family)
MNILIYLFGGIIIIIVGLLLIFQSLQLGAGIGAIVFGVLLVALYLYHRLKKQPHKNL